MTATATLAERVQGRRNDPAMLYLAAFVALGLAATLLGPAIPLLRDLTGADESEISLLFVIPAPGYIVGATVAGRLYDRGGGHRVLAGGLLVMAAGALFVPFATSSVLLLGVAFAVVGIGMSFVDVGCNALLVWSRDGNVGSIMNALHLCFGIGALIGPLSVGFSEWAFEDIWSASLVAAVPAVVVALAVLRRPSPTPRVSGHNMAAATAAGRPMTSRGALALIAVFFAVYVGLELGFAGWISTFAEETGLGEAPIPALTAATFWAGFTACRVASIPLARRVSSERMLAVSCTAAVAAAGLLVVAGDVAAVVWFATFAFGASVAPQYPMMVAMAEERIGLSGGATSVIVGASSLGGLVLPWTIGQMLDARGAEVMPQVITVAALVLLGWFVVVERRTRRSGQTTI